MTSSKRGEIANADPGDQTVVPPAREAAGVQTDAAEPARRRRPRGRIIILVTALCLVVAAVIAFVALRPLGHTPAEPVPATVPVAIAGVDLPKNTTLGIVLTQGDGMPGSDWNQAAQGARVAQQRLSMGGSDPDLIVENDFGTTSGAREAVDRLTARGVAGIILATDGPQITEAVARAQAAGVPVLLVYTSLSDTDASSVAGVWSLTPEAKATAVAFSKTLQEFSRPLHVDAGPGLPDGISISDVLAVSDGADLDELAADVAHRTGADPSAGDPYTGDPEQASPTPVTNLNDAVVISGRPVNQAMIVRALQARHISVPIVLTPGATSPAFATRLGEQGGSASTNLITVGAAWNDSVALSNDPHGRAMSAFLAGLRLGAQSNDVLDLSEEVAFADVAAAADVRSHDAVVALALAVSAAGSTEPAEVGQALDGLELGPADGLGGPDLDFARAEAFAGEVTALSASDQQLGLRPGAGQLLWFEAPDSP